MKLWTGTCAVLAIIFTWMIMNSETQTLAQSKPVPSPQVVERSQKATFGGGCFWCTEAMLEDGEAILSVAAGYAGAHVKNPSYRHVCEGTTGHAEVVQVTFDPVKITYKRVLELFWRSHDPTSLNRQGADVGDDSRLNHGSRVSLFVVTSSCPWSVVGSLGFMKIPYASYDVFELLIAEDWAWARRCTRAPPQLQAQWSWVVRRRRRNLRARNSNCACRVDQPGGRRDSTIGRRELDWLRPCQFEMRIPD